MDHALKDEKTIELVHAWTLPFAATLGSTVRAVGIFLDVRAGLPAAQRKALTIKARELTLSLPHTAAGDFARLLARVSKALQGVESLPIIPREIEDILGITSTERRRWLADGRLPSAGTRTVRLRGRAKGVTFHIFDPKIAEDVLDRGLVDAWREDDALAAAERRRKAVWKAKLARSKAAKPSHREENEDKETPQLRGWAEFEREGLLR